jgi:hypothetical protein
MTGLEDCIRLLVGQRLQQLVGMTAVGELTASPLATIFCSATNPRWTLTMTGRASQSLP